METQEIQRIKQGRQGSNKTPVRHQQDSILKHLGSTTEWGIKKLGVKLKLITDGDVAGALLVSDKKYNVDIFLGIGGGPEGVLAASALDAFGCKFQGRFLFKTEEDIRRAKEMGIDDLNKKYSLHEIIKGDSLFCATGITSGELVSGVRQQNEKFYTETLVAQKGSIIDIVIQEEPST